MRSILGGNLSVIMEVEMLEGFFIELELAYSLFLYPSITNVSSSQ
jgi:hypothetical protein